MKTFTKLIDFLYFLEFPSWIPGDFDHSNKPSEKTIKAIRNWQKD